MKKIKQIVKGLTIGTMSFIMSFTSLKVNAKSEDLIRNNFNYNFQTKIEEKITEIPTTGTEQSEMLKNAKLNIAYVETFDSQFSGNDGHVHGWLSSFTNYHINHFLTCSLKVKEEQPDNFPKYFQEHLDAVISFNQKEDEVNSLIERLKATKDENKQNILVWKTSFFNQFGYIDEYGGQSAKELLSHYRQLAEKIYNETGYTLSLIHI